MREGTLSHMHAYFFLQNVHAKRVSFATCKEDNIFGVPMACRKVGASHTLLIAPTKLCTASKNKGRRSLDRSTLTFPSLKHDNITRPDLANLT
jgi:hypothetical protein